MGRFASPLVILLVAFGLLGVSARADGRPCGRWTVTMTSDSAHTAELRLNVRHCGADQPSHIPPSCRGRYRCKGRACPSRRGGFTAFGDLLNLNSVSGRYCITGPPASDPSSYRYTCYTRRDVLRDQGTLSCRTDVACDGFGC